MDRRLTKLPSRASRLIAMAEGLVGDVESVRKEIGCSLADFRSYRAGAKQPSWPELERLIDMILREQSTRIAKNRESIASRRSRTPKRS